MMGNLKLNVKNSSTPAPRKKPQGKNVSLGKKDIERISSNFDENDQYEEDEYEDDYGESYGDLGLKTDDIFTAAKRQKTSAPSKINTVEVTEDKKISRNPYASMNVSNRRIDIPYDPETSYEEDDDFDYFPDIVNASEEEKEEIAVAEEAYVAEEEKKEKKTPNGLISLLCALLGIALIAPLPLFDISIVFMITRFVQLACIILAIVLGAKYKQDDVKAKIGFVLGVITLVLLILFVAVIIAGSFMFGPEFIGLIARITGINVALLFG